MKKQLLILSALILGFMLSLNAQEEVIIGFDFADNTDTNYEADSGLDGNLSYDIRVESLGETETMEFSYTDGATDYAATSTAWNDGAEDKVMSIKFKADGYENFKISSKQYSDATGPKDFKLQWRFSGGDWADVTDGAITVGTDWTTGVVNELVLPAEMNNPGSTSIYVRWIMTSNTSVEDGTVDAAGSSKIDDIVIVASPMPTPDAIIGFDFSDNTDTEFEATSGTEGNISYDIRAENGTEGSIRTLSYTDGAADYAATVDGWDNGIDDKFWSIKFKADGFTGMKVSSKQFSDTDGPKNFKLQWRISGGEWADIDGAAVTLASDWTTGVVEELDLPVEMEGNGTSSIYIRWIMTDNTSVSDGTVTATGISKIDDILVTGFAASGVMQDLYASALNVYPNPCDNYFNIESADVITTVEVYNTNGALVQRVENINDFNANVSAASLSSGLYFVKIYSDDNRMPESKKIIVK